MRFASSAPNYLAIVRGKIDVPHPTLPVNLRTEKELVCEFGIQGPEFTMQDEAGRPHVAAAISGGSFDTDEAAERFGWAPEEKEMVEGRLLQLCRMTPEYVWVLEDRAPVAPVPNYDEIHHKQIPTVAQALHMEREFLAYEAATRNRAEAVAKLTELVAALDAERDAEQALTAA